LGGTFGEQVIVDPLLVQSDPIHSFGLQKSAGLGVIGGEQVAFSLSAGFILADSIKDTERWFRVIGFDVDGGSGIGGDILIGGTPGDEDYSPGLSLSLDILGEGCDAHGYYTYTGETEYVGEKLFVYWLLFDIYLKKLRRNIYEG